MGKDKQVADRFTTPGLPRLVLVFDNQMRAWRQLQDVSRHPDPAGRFAELAEEYRLSTLRLVVVEAEKKPAGALAAPSEPTGGGSNAKPR